LSRSYALRGRSSCLARTARRADRSSCRTRKPVFSAGRTTSLETTSPSVGSVPTFGISTMPVTGEVAFVVGRWRELAEHQVRLQRRTSRSESGRASTVGT
jgi:hypothetical protein